MNSKIITLLAAMLFLVVIAVNPNPAQAQSSTGKIVWTKLEQQLGPELSAVLVNPDNTAAVREFAQTMIPKNSIRDILLAGTALGTGLVPAGWGVVEDVSASQFDVAKLRPRAILRDGESFVGGDEMRRRAVVAKANWGLADGQRILAGQDKLSAEFRGNYIVLSGTVLRGSGGSLRVAYLRWDGGRWVLGFLWLVDGWRDGGRFAARE